MSSVKSVSFSNKVIVITGASSGIGAALAKYLAKHGAKVVLAARSLDNLQKVANETGLDESKYLIVAADVTKKADHEKVLVAAVKKFGKVSAWINNAGAGVFKKFEETSEDDLDSMFAVNTKSVLFGTQTAISHFKQHSTSVDTEGVVINVSSVLGRVALFSNLAAYNASKHAVNSLTTNARVDLQNEGFKHVHVLLFSPGLVETEFNKNAIGGPNDSIDMSTGQNVNEVVEIVGNMLLNPESNADVYSRPVYKDLVVGYLSADNVRTVESGPAFSH